MTALLERDGLGLIGALTSLGWLICRAFKAVGVTIVGCDNSEGMAVMGAVTIFLAVGAVLTGAAMWSLIRR
jgi:hypothetical protein